MQEPVKGSLWDAVMQVLLGRFIDVNSFNYTDELSTIEFLRRHSIARFVIALI